MLYDNLTINAKGHLVFAGIDTLELTQKYGTPAYIMDEDRIRSRCRTYISAMKEHFGEGSLPLFAGKALCIKALYRILEEENMGIDVVSPGEIYTAYVAGFPMERAYFHGNNKTDADIAFAMEKGVGFFICDNVEELIAVNEAAKKQECVQNILLRITPGIDPHTHAKINTGKVDSKFGAAIETGQALDLTEKALSLPHISLKGFHCHIGSQIFECKPFVDAAKIMLQFIGDVQNRFGYRAEYLNLGGGMGVPYTEDDPSIDYAANIAKIAEMIKSQCVELNVEMPNILMEPGRSIVADAGITLYTVGGKKEIPGFKNYVSIDGGMTDNPRYTLYASTYTVLNAGKMNEASDYCCTIAGRCCESGDLIQENVMLPQTERGDILAVLTTGAYNYAMASHYNAISKPPIIMIKDGESRKVVRRESFEEMIGCQI